MRLVACDIETRDGRGASYEYWRPDFRIFSMSLAWRDDAGQIVHWFSTDSLKIAQQLLKLSQEQARLIIHNLSFSTMQVVPNSTWSLC